MTQKDAPDDDRIGHDPLEWLEQGDDDLKDAPMASEAASVQDGPETEASAGALADLTRLPEKLTVQSIELLHAQWLGVLDSLEDHTLRLDCSDLVEVDCAGFQLLNALQRWAESHDKSFHLDALQNNVRAQLKLLGGTPLLERADS